MLIKETCETRTAHVIAHTSLDQTCSAARGNANVDAENVWRVTGVICRKGSLFAKCAHPSGVIDPLPDETTKCICLLAASHEFMHNAIGKNNTTKKAMSGFTGASGGRGYKL